MAIAMLKAARKLIHKPHHDLESFYWVLLWVILRHTVHNFGQPRCEKVFVYGDDDSAKYQKKGWLEDAPAKPLLIKKNIPLQILIFEYGQLVLENLTTRCLTHDAVLTLFDNALAMGGWPTADIVPCTLLDRPKTKSLLMPLRPIKPLPHRASAPLPSLIHSLQKSMGSTQVVPGTRDRGVSSAPGDVSVVQNSQPETTSITCKKRANGELDTGAVTEEVPVAGPSTLGTRFSKRLRAKRDVDST